MFSVAKFEDNNDADSVCKELFANRSQIPKKKEKVKHGKVAKKVKKPKKMVDDEEKLKEDIRNMLNNNFSNASLKPIKHKKQKVANTCFTPQKQSKKTSASEESEPELEKKPKKKKKKRPLEDTEMTEKEESVNNKGKERRKKKREHQVVTTASAEPTPQNYSEKKREKLKQKLEQALISQPAPKKQPQKDLTLRQRMMQRLQAARFRFINEQIYSTDSKEAQRIFREDPEAFSAYHDGYRQQVGKWPLNPVDVIIKSIMKLPKNTTVADFGCGEAKLAQSVPHKVHSFDLVAISDRVVSCDMAHVPLGNQSVDVVVFCLSLMGTNLHEYLLEANRVLKVGGTLKIAEVESRFDDINQFIEALKRFNFKNTWKDLSHNLFYFLDFKKEANVKNKKKLPTISLHPCLYKKR